MPEKSGVDATPGLVLPSGPAVCPHAGIATIAIATNERKFRSIVMPASLSWCAGLTGARQYYRKSRSGARVVRGEAEAHSAGSFHRAGGQIGKGLVCPPRSAPSVDGNCEIYCRLGVARTATPVTND